ncbi:MAG: cytochrome c3 family protein [Saezia sp.]
MMKYIFAMMMALCCIGYVHAVERAPMKGGMDGRANHAALYDGSCTSCHGADPQKNVTDQTCVQCHGEMKKIQLDASRLPIPEANPHASVHFGEGASCLACHAEHKQKAPLCSDCHTSWFEKM